MKSRPSKLSHLATFPDELLNARQVAKKAGVSERLIRRLCAERLIPTIRFGGAVRFSWPAVLLALTEEHLE